MELLPIVSLMLALFVQSAIVFIWVGRKMTVIENVEEDTRDHEARIRTLESKHRR